ncbi:MipA/OmpV family protein [Exilibacterium tricleocarpae]|uniref:MipA/OmpV family protein n=1 Tax=Exilibacterium tricleocarpae TaxID=2591008 RepID=A0A545TFP1_9GAMM|nr:MipA/OmpV family protein [Exilibacterium tricleocarpae]TQV75996.1 MipA/OmpV family protein [Exilibacterium tricleocarpae]
MPYSPRLTGLSLMLLSLTGWPVLAADNGCDKDDPNCVQVGTWQFSLAVGLGARSNPVEGGDTIPLVLVPQFSYYGDRFFIDNLDFGYTLYDSPKQSFSLIASPGYDRVFFQRNDLQNFFVESAGLQTSLGLPGTGLGFVDDDLGDEERLNLQVLRERERRVTYLGGLEWSYGFDGAQLQFNYLHEVTGEHHGDEARLALAIPLYSQRWQLAATLGATWKSDRLVSYYYGEKRLYEPGSAVNPFARVSYTRPLNEKWTLRIFGHYQKLGSSIANSPIVEEDDVLTVFVGGVYSF